MKGDGVQIVNVGHVKVWNEDTNEKLLNGSNSIN